MVTQSGIVPSSLFHQLLRKKLEASKGEKVQLKLEIYNELSEIPDKLLKWIKKNPEDKDVIIQYRPATLLRRLKIIVHEQDETGKFILNPVFTASKPEEVFQKMAVKKVPVKKGSINYFQTSNTSLVTFREQFMLSLMVFAGGFLLWRNAKKSFHKFLQQLDDFADMYNINIYFLGVIPTPSFFFNTLITGTFNRYLKKIPYKRLVYVDVYSAILQDHEKNFTGNKFHLSERGHQIISEALFHSLKPAGEKIKPTVSD
jgi:hypothetical protein